MKANKQAQSCATVLSEDTPDATVEKVTHSPVQATPVAASTLPMSPPTIEPAENFTLVPLMPSVAHFTGPGTPPGTSSAPTTVPSAPSVARTNAVPHFPQSPLRGTVDDDVTVVRVTPKKDKKGRHARFSAVEDLVIVREVAAAKAHVATYGNVSKKFEEAAERTNENPLMRTPVTGKCVQDRYRRLQSSFDRSDKRDQLRSGVGGEVGEMDELLLMCREARDDVDARRGAEKRAAKEIDDEKERVGRELQSLATSRKSSDLDHECGSRKAAEQCEGRPRKSQRFAGGSDMEQFAIHIRDADLARIDFDKQKLAFEKEKMEMEVRERDREREERREALKASQELELAKFRMMIEMFSKKSEK